MKVHNISQAYYGLTKKFFPRFEGEYRVKAKLGENAYILQDLGQIKRTIVANVRQLNLLNRVNRKVDGGGSWEPP